MADARLARTVGSIIPQASSDVQADGSARSTRTVLARLGAVAAVVGVVLLALTTMLHPGSADPNHAHDAFAEYAADSIWVWSHIGQFAAFVFLGAAMVALAATLESGRSAAFARFGLIGTAAFVTLAAALQAVDGIALKVMVDRWADSTGEARALAFEATYAVRQIEIGLASLFSLVFGLTVITFGMAIVCSERYPTWLGVAGMIGGAGTLAGGLSQATTGFSELAMMFSMGSSLVLLIWAVVVGVLMWRLAAQLPTDGDAA